MKATFSFNLPEEQEEYETFTKADKYASIISEYANWLRGISKHGGDQKEHEHIEFYRNKFHEICNEEEIDALCP